MLIDKEKGVQPQTLSDFLDEIKKSFQQKFGQDLDLDDSTIAGALANILAQNDMTVENVAIALYNAIFLLKSSGRVIDDHGADEHIYRKPANNAYVYLQIKCYVDENSPTIITTDDGEFSTADGHIFQILDDVTISQQGTDDSGQPLVDEDGNPLGVATVQAISTETGADNNVMPNTIVNAEQAIDGFYSVTNPAGATGGTDIETDDSLKYRIFNNRLFKPNSNQSGLENAVRNIDNVVDARVVNNVELTPDKYGNPAKSIHVYVVGGNDLDIAQTIQNNILTTKTVGNVTATAYDVGGKAYDIHFDKAKTVPVNIDITISIDDSKFNNDSGANLIKQNIINYFSYFKMGSLVDFTKLYAPCYSVSGVKAVDLKLSKNSDELQPNVNISVDDFELPVTDENHITINIVRGDADV